jgi:phage-related protein
VLASKPVHWIKAARKAFDEFPERVRSEATYALGIAAQGQTADTAKLLRGLGSGVFEIVLNDRSGTYRVVYAVKIGSDLWVVHAFQKKSTRGIKTPAPEIDVIRDRLSRLREMLT